MPPLELPEFEWSEGFACGVDLVDRQHRNLVDLINLLRSAILRGDTVSSANCAWASGLARKCRCRRCTSGATAAGLPSSAGITTITRACCGMPSARR
ncbi:hypothetical protein FQZ97_817400 [compost metagenome]